MQKEDFQGLIRKYIDGTASKAEKRLLEEYYKRLSGNINPLPAEEEETLRKEILSNIFEKAGISEVPIKRIAWWSWAAAAVVIIAISGSYFLFFNKTNSEIAKRVAQVNKPDVAPGGTKAILTLSGGHQVILGSMARDTILTEGAAIVANANGRLAYNSGTAPTGEIVYNTLATPRGGQYQLTLPDGSQVWLNSESSIKYPTAFIGNDRKVEITGEVYFEVTKDKAKPFKVKLNEMEVEVLGTHFNVNGYSDETSVKTTLLEGSVKITKGEETEILRPGEQGILENNQITKTKDIDLDKIMAWKNGWFEFDQTGLTTIMRQVSRWYDVDITYEGNLRDDKFGGRISKNLPLSDILKSLEANGNGVKFKLEGKKLIVQP